MNLLPDGRLPPPIAPSHDEVEGNGGNLPFVADRDGPPPSLAYRRSDGNGNFSSDDSSRGGDYCGDERSDEGSDEDASVVTHDDGYQAVLPVLDGDDNTGVGVLGGSDISYDEDHSSSTMDAIFDQLDLHSLHQEEYNPYWTAPPEQDQFSDVLEDEDDVEADVEAVNDRGIAAAANAAATRLSNRPPAVPAGPAANPEMEKTPQKSHPDIGKEYDYPADHPSHAYLGPKTDLGMMRFYHLCDSAGTSRTFMDEALKIIGDAIDQEGFNPSMAKSRHAFVEQKKKEYKMKEPICVDVPLANVHGDPLTVENPNQIHRRKRDVASVIKFDFEGMVLDLLQDRGIFGNLDNLLVNPVNPFHPYVNKTGTLDEIMDGCWYEDTMTEMLNAGMDVDKEFLLPLVLYLDKTGVDNNQRYGLEPVLVTFAFIRRHIRRTNRANRILGFVPDLELKSSAVKKVQQQRAGSKSAAAANYHACLDVIVRQIAEAEERGVYTYLRLGDKVKMVRLRFKVALVIGDGKSGDTLCLRVGSHKSANRLSRACNVPQTLSDDPFHECQFLTQTRVHALVMVARATHIPFGTSRKKFKDEKKAAQDELIKLSSHTVVNAFDGIDFGANPAGIFGATPVDTMHCFLLGIIKYIMKLALDNLTPTKKEALDLSVDTIFVGLRTSEKDDFPRSSFAKGYSNLTQITADEWTGMLMTLLLAVRISPSAMDTMRSVFTNEEDVQVKTPKEKRKKLNANQEQEEPDDTEPEEDAEVMLQPCSLEDFIQLAEALLCFHAWYKLGDPFPWADKQSSEDGINHSIRTMLKMIKTYMPRLTGNGWKIQKFHDLLHLSRDMAMFGSPQNFDAGPYESSLRFWAKRFAKTAQMRGYKTFAKQVGDRIFEYHCMGRARRDMGLTGVDEGLPPPKKVRILKEGPICLTEPYPVFKIVTDPVTKVVSSKWLAGNQKKRKGNVDVHPAIIRYFSDGPIDGADEEAPRYGYTRLSIGDLSFRAHPNYKNEGPWYDWSYVVFQRDLVNFPFTNMSKTSSPMYGPQFIPVKILCFLGDGTGAGETSMALVHACEWRENNSEDSVLTEVWDLEYTQPSKKNKNYRKAVIRCVHTSSLVGRFFVVEETPGVREGFSTKDLHPVSTSVLLVKPRLEWANAFT